MTAPDVDRLKRLLVAQVAGQDLASEVLRHDIGAAINRNRLTRNEEGVNSLNTDQLAWIVIGHPDLRPGHMILHGLALSALIDARWDIWREVIACGLTHPGWTWPAWADGFAGGEDELIGRLTTIGDLRERCGAVCLAAATAPAAIGPRLLDLFLAPGSARVYHRLLTAAMRGPLAGGVATVALRKFRTRLDVLFAGDVDATLAAMTEACDGDPEQLLDGLEGGCGELTNVARARRLLIAGKAREALARCESVRFLSLAYPQAMVVAALAALELGENERAAAFAERIEDAPLRLKTRCRIAQAEADVASELAHLVELHELVPDDSDAFCQLVATVERLNRHELSRRLCLEAQERFFDQPAMMQFIRRRIAV